MAELDIKYTEVEKQHNSKFGQDILGPIIHRWLHALHEYSCKFSDNDSVFLMCARAGVRIEELYSIFQKTKGKTHFQKRKLFWISRVAVAKGIYNQKPELSINTIANEFYHLEIKDLIKAILKNDHNRINAINFEASDLSMPGRDFSIWLKYNHHNSRLVKDYLEKCSESFEKYLEELLNGSDNAILVDSGWGGSTQNMLSKSFEMYNWYGLYFGTSYLSHHDRSIAPNAVGLLFEGDQYDPKKPETCFIRHRHLIESLLEPNGPSIEEIAGGELHKYVNECIDQNLHEDQEETQDILYLSVKKYIEENANESIASMISKYNNAIKKLDRILITPTRFEAKCLSKISRSRDFGKSGKVSVVSTPDNDQSRKDFRIKKALWVEGQIALEYEGKIAQEMQFRVNNLSNNSSYFDPLKSEVKKDKLNISANVSTKNPKVAIITRTKNRPILFARAAKSVALQTFDDYVWVVVNDGGDEISVIDVIKNSTVDPRKVILVSHENSVGMEAASNAGISASNSDYIVIHDDDDSWEKSFLNETVSELDVSNIYAGVVTHSRYVSEEVLGDTVKVYDKIPYKNWFHNISIQEMANENLFPPIAFLYRRELWEEVGGYNELLPVLGDWFFNMEFLFRKDIKVISKPLANYHHRDRGDSRNAIYSNSVIGGVSKHVEFASVAKNELVRRYRKDTGIVSVLLGSIVTENRSVRNDLTKNLENLMSKFNSNEYDEVDRLFVSGYLSSQVVKSTKNLIPWKKKCDINYRSSWHEIRHFLKKSNLNIETHPSFNERLYLEDNRDVAEILAIGKLNSAYFHYIVYGKEEGRKRTSINSE